MEIVDALMKLNSIFKTKNWTTKDVDDFVFNSFCRLFDNLNSDHRKLVLELTENYTWVTFNEYQSLILKVLDGVEKQKLNGIKKIYFFPILKPEDEGKTKSGPFLMYHIKSFKRHLKNYSDIKFEFVTKFESLLENFSIQENETIFIVDDYIGSGETLQICLSELQKNKSITDEKLNIISIACQKAIHDTMSSKFAFYSEIILKKGISDYYVNPELETNTNIMLEIEKMIPGGSHYSFGYNESEALITLMRTPDNTFPIFWKQHRKVNTKFEAPFSREESIEL